MKESLLIGDVGGTNARFALADIDGSGSSMLREYQCAEFGSITDAINCYLDEKNLHSPKWICLAVAGPLVEGTARFTNNSWTVSCGELRQKYKADHAWLINDFEALAWSLPLLSRNDVMPVGNPLPRSLDTKQYTLAVIGPGTGLGAAGLRKCGEHFTAITGEASHCGFAPETAEQVALLTVLQSRFERVSDERLVSGQGLENLYWGLSRIHGENYAQLTAAEIMQAGCEQSDSLAGKTVGMFFRILGQVAGNLALTLGAFDGIYIGGGIVRRYPQLLADSRFRAGFEAKGRHRKLMETIPTQLILNQQASLLGAASVARMHIRIN
jgi:glucokinase